MGMISIPFKVLGALSLETMIGLVSGKSSMKAFRPFVCLDYTSSVHDFDD